MTQFKFVVEEAYPGIERWRVLLEDCKWGSEMLDSLCLVGFHDAMQAREDSETAREVTNTLVFDGTLEGPGDGEAQSFHLCLWSCLMAKSMGVEKAGLLGDNRMRHCEDETWCTCEKKEMDAFNNEKGREYVRTFFVCNCLPNIMRRK